MLLFRFGGANRLFFFFCQVSFLRPFYHVVEEPF
jgi:hypothetical protein